MGYRVLSLLVAATLFLSCGHDPGANVPPDVQQEDPQDTDPDDEDEYEPVFAAVIRDFKDTHPDFESMIGVDPGIVRAELGDDGKPVYDGDPDTLTTTGADEFNQWYNDVPGVNLSFPLSITLSEGVEPGVFEYGSTAFFPIDGQGWGNEGRDHNFHFTTEFHARFVYEGGETFVFNGDDDVWVFVNGKLAIDLGGVHAPLQGSIDMDAEFLGLVPGETYDLDFFHAQRHTTQSNFRITTTIPCFLPSAD